MKNDLIKVLFEVIGEFFIIGGAVTIGANMNVHKTSSGSEFFTLVGILLVVGVMMKFLSKEVS